MNLKLEAKSIMKPLKQRTVLVAERVIPLCIMCGLAFTNTPYIFAFIVLIGTVKIVNRVWSQTKSQFLRNIEIFVAEDTSPQYIYSYRLITAFKNLEWIGYCNSITVYHFQTKFNELLPQQQDTRPKHGKLVTMEHSAELKSAVS